MTGMGGGSLMTPILILLFGFNAKVAVGTDIPHAAALLWVAGVSHLLHGDVDKHAMAWLLVGSIPGVLIGSHMSIRIPERALRIAFGLVLILSGIKIVGVPQASLVIAIALGVGAVTGGALGIRQLLVRRVAAQNAA